MSYRGRVLIAVVAGCLAVWAGIIALGYVLAYHGETALLAAGCVLYVALLSLAVLRGLPSFHRR